MDRLTLSRGLMLSNRLATHISELIAKLEQYLRRSDLDRAIIWIGEQNPSGNTITIS